MVYIWHCFPRKKKSCFFGNINSYLLGSPTGESRDAKIAPNSSSVNPAVADDGYTIWLFNIAMENPHF